MTSARTRTLTSTLASTLASLRGTISRLEAAGLQPTSAARRPLGHAAADSVLQGGLVRGALHEVFAMEGRYNAAASGFAAGLAWRAALHRPLLWVRQDFVAREQGALSMQGFSELGLDPRRVITVRAQDIATALRVTADALACDALGAVVMDAWGETRLLDLVASRKLTLAAQASGVTCFLLRSVAQPAASTAETRWVVRSARSPVTSLREAWGSPVLEAALVRNRHGQTGQWIMEWNCHECLFREPATYSQSASALPSDRPAAAAARPGRDAIWRRAG